MVRDSDRERWSDQDLVAAIADRDRQAFAAFYQRYLSRISAYLLRETRDPEAAADLTAEVFAAVLLSARRFRADSESAGPWILGIARNKLGSSRRRGRVEDRARRRLGAYPLELHDSDLDRVLAIADEGSGPLAKLVDALPDGERRAVQARVVHEKSYEDIAAELRCSALVVRKRVSRGLARIRDQLRET